MPNSGLPDEAAELLATIGTSAPRALSQLVTLAASQVTGCSGATATLWRDGEAAVFAASHPDLSELAEVERTCGRGPVFDALAGEGPVGSPDMLEEDRWPEYAQAALVRGVRCSVTMVHRAGPATVTLSLFGARPRLLSPDDLPLARLLTVFGSAVLGNAANYADAQRAAVQLREATQSRAVVDQARGILMATLGCTPEDALERMRDISQRHGMRVTEVAQRIIESPDFTGS